MKSSILELLMQHPMNDKPLHGLNEWLHFLKGHRFPVKSESLMGLKKHISHPDATIENLQAKIKAEPLIAFALLIQANNSIPNKRGEVKNPYHAGSMVGMKGIANAAKSLVPYTFSKNNPAHVAMQREIQTSYEAACIANRWSAEKNFIQDEIFWLTFFRNIPRWLMWFYAHSTMEEIQRRLEKGESAIKAETEVLGCRIDEITVNLYKQWEAPRNIINSFSSTYIPNNNELKTLAKLTHTPDMLPSHPEDKRLTILTNSPLIYVYCANKLIQEIVLHGWQGNTLHFYYRIIATVIHDYLGKVIQWTHLGSAEAATLYINTAKRPIACELLSPDLYLNNIKKEAISKTAPIKANKKPSSNVLETLKQQLSQSDLDTKTRLGLALKAIKSSLPSVQQAILLKHSDKKISPILQFGGDISQIQQVQWSSTSSLFSKLAQKRSAIRAEGQTLFDIVDELPTGASNLIDTQGHLMLASTSVSESETCIVWLTTRNHFSEKDYTTLKKIVMLISHDQRKTP